MIRYVDPTRRGTGDDVDGEANLRASEGSV
jgi:hypothetical protein